MVTIVKREWHQVESRYSADIDEDFISEVYPDLDEIGVSEKLENIEAGIIDIDSFVEDAVDAGVDFDWQHVLNDWWTDRKGGYDVTYELDGDL